MGTGLAPRQPADRGLQGQSRGLRFKATDDWESRRFRWRGRTEVRQQMAATFDRDYSKLLRLEKPGRDR